MKKLGILLFATGNYRYYLESAVETLQKRYLNDTDKTFYIFTDYENIIIKKSYNNIVIIPINIDNYITFFYKIYKFIIDNKHLYESEDYLQLFNVNLICQKNITLDEIPLLTNKLIVSGHGWRLEDTIFKSGREYYDSCEFEKRPESTSYIPYVEGAKYKYFQKSGVAAPKERFLDLCEWCNKQLIIDESNNIVPIWHDESILNKYIYEFYKDIDKLYILEPSLYNLSLTFEHIALKDKAKIYLPEKNYELIRHSNTLTDIAFNESTVEKYIQYTDNDEITHRLRVKRNRIYDPITFQYGLLIKDTHNVAEVIWSANSTIQKIKKQ